MGDISQGIDSFFWLSLVTLICGGLSLSIRYAYRSKCKNIKLCGCIKIDRDVDIEEREDMAKSTIASKSSQSIGGDITH